MRLAAIALWAVCFSTNVFAQTGSPLADSPLPPGKPAGVHQAVARGTENAILIGVGIIGLAIAGVLIAKAEKSSTSSATSTSP
jgi:hypothetical protein